LRPSGVWRGICGTRPGNGDGIALATLPSWRHSGASMPGEAGHFHGPQSSRPAATRDSLWEAPHSLLWQRYGLLYGTRLACIRFAPSVVCGAERPPCRGPFNGLDGNALHLQPGLIRFLRQLAELFFLLFDFGVERRDDLLA
jgi:hypothetical protein